MKKRETARYTQQLKIQTAKPVQLDENFARSIVFEGPFSTPICRLHRQFIPLLSLVQGRERWVPSSCSFLCFHSDKTLIFILKKHYGSMLLVDDPTTRHSDLHFHSRCSDTLTLLDKKHIAHLISEHSHCTWWREIADWWRIEVWYDFIIMITEYTNIVFRSLFLRSRGQMDILILWSQSSLTLQQIIRSCSCDYCMSIKTEK